MQDFKDNALLDDMIARTALVRREDGSMVEVPLNEAQRTAFAVQYAAQSKGSAKSIGRNSQCPCGSGKKYKKCCLKKADEEATARRKMQEEAELDAVIKKQCKDAEGELDRLNKELEEALSG